MRLLFFKLTVNLTDRLEIALGSSAKRANPRIRYIFERCSWSNSSIRIALCRVINVAARLALVLFHCLIVLVVVNCFFVAQMSLNKYNSLL